MRPGLQRFGPIAVLLTLWIAAAFLALRIGTVFVSWTDIVSLLRQGSSVCSSTDALFVLCTIRLPRVLLSGLCGYILALSGAVMQGLFRTPMADPYLLGMLGGSSLGVSLFLWLGIGGSVYFLSTGAFLGGLFAIGIVIFTSRHKNGTQSTSSLLLSGVACSAVCSAATTSFLFFASPKVDTQRFIFWLLGSFSRSQSSHVVLLFIAVFLMSPFFFSTGQKLNLLRFGDSMASHLGVSPVRWRTLFLVSTTVLTSAVVACVGPIGFIGLFVPHGARWIVGHDHRKLLPVSALLGAIVLTCCDTLARFLWAPSIELPVGVITALLGAPSIWILIQAQRKQLHVAHPHE